MHPAEAPSTPPRRRRSIVAAEAVVIAVMVVLLSLGFHTRAVTASASWTAEPTPAAVDGPAAASVLLVMDLGAGRWISCSGGVLDDGHVITAAHCFPDVVGSRQALHGVRVGVGVGRTSSGGDAAGRWCTGVRASVAPDWAEGAAGGSAGALRHDAAVVTVVCADGGLLDRTAGWRFQPVSGSGIEAADLSLWSYDGDRLTITPDGEGAADSVQMQRRHVHVVGRVMALSGPRVVAVPMRTGLYALDTAGPHGVSGSPVAEVDPASSGRTVPMVGLATLAHGGNQQLVAMAFDAAALDFIRAELARV